MMPKESGIKDAETGEASKEGSEDPNVLIGQFQLLQQQLQNVLIQKEGLRMSMMEIDHAVEELDKSKEEAAYKITGEVMVKKPVSELKKDLAESKETLGIRVRSLEKTERTLTESLRTLQDKVKKIIK
jgi:prefoldin beta subunit